MDKLLGLCLYPIYMDDVKPHYSIRKAFEANFSPFIECDWVNISAKIGLKKTQLQFIELLKQHRPEYTFMQLQNSVNMDVPTIREMARYTKIINWTGDVRGDKAWIDWFCQIGREIHLTLFTNENHAALLMLNGINADYLQVSADTGWYKKMDNTASVPEIVFCANRAPQFPLGKLRDDTVKTLNRHFGNRFEILGGGWDALGFKTRVVDNEREAILYNNAKICLSVSSFNLTSYHSDRLMRIMACGGFALSHEFDGYEKSFTKGENIETFHDMNDLIAKCEYYLNNDGERERIALNGYNAFNERMTWDYRCKELIKLLEKYENIH